MLSAPAHRPPARLGALGAVLALTATLLLPIWTGPAAAQSEAAPALELLVDEISPVAPETSVTVRGRVRNPAAQASQAVVSLRIGRVPLGSRSELEWRTTALAGGSPDAQTSALTVPPGGEAAFSLTADLTTIRLPSPGVYPLTLRTVSPSAAPAVVSTFLPWIPPGSDVAPTRLVWLWPLAAGVNRDPEQAFFDPSLAASIAPGGRLSRVLDVAARNGGLPVTWVLDPQLLEDLRVMREEYAVRPIDDSPRTPSVPSAVPAEDSPESAQAAQWLARYDAEVAPRLRFVLPYADPNVSAVVRAGQLGAVRAAIERAQALTANPAAPDASPAVVSWPHDGLLTADAASVIFEGGAATTILGPSAFSAAAPLPYTRDSRTPLTVSPTRTATALVADSVLSDLASRPATDGGENSPALLRQRFLAETALISVERPSDGRSVVVAPPRQWDPASSVVTELIGASLPWAQTVTGDAVLAEQGTGTVGEPLTYPPEARSGELPARHLRAVERFETRALAVSALLDEPEDMRRAYAAYALRLRAASLRASASPEGGPEGARRDNLLALGRGLLTRYETGVRIVSSGVTLGARDGPIPVTVVNTLDEAVKVRVRLTPRLPRLVVQETPEITVAAGRRAQVNVPASGVANGDVIVDAQLLAGDDQEIGDPVPIQVGVNNVAEWGSYLTVGAAVMFVVAALVRAVRRVRAHRRGQSGETTAAA